jgi:hypothetical protein
MAHDSAELASTRSTSGAAGEVVGNQTAIDPEPATSSLKTHVGKDDSFVALVAIFHAAQLTRACALASTVAGHRHDLHYRGSHG